MGTAVGSPAAHLRSLHDDGAHRKPAVAPHRARRLAVTCREFRKAIRPRAGVAVTFCVNALDGSRHRGTLSNPVIIDALRRAFADAEDQMLFAAGEHPAQLHVARMERREKAAAEAEAAAAAAREALTAETA